MSAETIWNSILSERRQECLASLAEFRRSLETAGVHFGGRPLCNHLRPKFLTESEAAHLARVAHAVMKAIMEAKDLLLASEGGVDRIGLRPEELELVAIDPGYDHIAPCVRLDTFLTQEGPQCVELNGECPAGPAYAERLSERFAEHPLMAEFTRRVAWRFQRTLPPLLDTLLACYREWRGSSTRRPVIAIVDYENLPTAAEFELCREFFASEGYEAVVVDPRTLDYDGDRLFGKGRPIDLVYRRVLTNEFLEHYDEVKNLHLAYRDHRVCVVNPFSSKVVHKKAIFALLTADDRERWMSPELIPLIDSAVPWTRVVTESRTLVDGAEIDLVPWILENRQSLVLKPNDEYGGKGITLGWEVDGGEWEAAVTRAVDGDFVVQRRIELVPEEFPSMARDLQPESLFVDLDPYIYTGVMHGALARLGAGGLCNVSSGGGQVPLVIVQEEMGDD